jgi:hypothetical protein
MRASFNLFFLFVALILAASSVMANANGGAKDGQHNQPKVATVTDTAIVNSTVTNAVAAGTNTVTATVTTSTKHHKNAAGRAEVPAVASVAVLAVAGLLLAAW